MGDVSVDLTFFFMLTILSSMFILYHRLMYIFRLYSIPVKIEKRIHKMKLEPKERFRDSQRKAENILMYRLANNEISKEEYTARMARL